MTKYRSIFYIFSIKVFCTMLLSGVIPSGIALAQETTIVTVSAPNEVNTGDQFAVNITVEPGTPVAGVQFSLSYDQSLVTVHNVIEGNLLSQEGANTYFSAGMIDNASGTVSGVVGAITTAGETVSTAGTFAIIVLTAGTIEGICPFTLSSIVVGNENGQPVPVATVNSQVTINARPMVNHNPVLDTIGNRSVYENELLQFSISATDEDADILTFSASGLPTGASFDPVTSTFSWVPTHDQVNEYTDVHFEVTDGEFSDYEDVTITVLGMVENEQDLVSPVIQEVTSSDVGTDSAVIHWVTTEPSTSQVEYWASPSQFSPLDETLVTQHEVNLTGLKPGTEYQYRTISRDEMGNLYVSQIYDFATSSQRATFVIKWLTITPAEAVIGQDVTVNALITNTSDIMGGYDVTLSIDSIIETTESIIDLAGGASEEVTFIITKETAGIYDLNINGTTYALLVNDVQEYEKAIELFNVVPNYENNTGVIISTRVEYGICKSYYSTLLSQPNSQLVLEVSLDDNPIEEVVLIGSNQSEQNTDIGSLYYVPDDGWTTGTYTFQLGLYIGGEMINESPQARLIISPSVAAGVVSWAVLGEIVLGTFIIALIVVLLMLHRSRDMLRDKY